MDFELTKPILPEKEGYEYGYAMFEQLPDIYVNGSKHEPAPSVDVSNINIIIINVVYLALLKITPVNAYM